MNTREQIAAWHAEGLSWAEMGRRLGRSPRTVAWHGLQMGLGSAWVPPTGAPVKPNLLHVLPELIEYRSDGSLVWRERGEHWFAQPSYAGRWNARYAGTPALSCATSSYLHGHILGRDLDAHRAVWALHHGRWPVAMLDHINGNPKDNRIENLREASAAENARNRSPNKGRTTKGVVRSGGKFFAKISVGRKSHHLGTFQTEEDAARAYDEASVKHHGDFARPNALRAALSPYTGGE